MAVIDTQRKIKGSLMGISVDGAFISCETNAELYFEKTFIPASSVSSGKYSESVPGMRKWRMTVDGLLLLRSMEQDFKTLFTAWDEDTLLTLEFRTRPSVEQYLIFRGNAYVAIGTLLAPNDGYSTWNVQFEGDGILNMDWEEFWLIINAMPPQADWPTIVEENPDLWGAGV